MKDPTYIELLEEQLNATNLEQQQDEAGIKSDNILLRRLYFTLLFPTSVQGNNSYSLLGKFDPPQKYLKHQLIRTESSEDQMKKVHRFLSKLPVFSLCYQSPEK